ncbi:MAG: outer membrane protein assembly factor BamB, partial [Cellvibrionales bacterium]|nr:outer membrane protein assembly factor BamB [Cellvibrionales bacterium]
LSACAFFGGGDEELDPTAPAKLQDFTPRLTVHRLWHHDLGRGPGQIHPPLLPAIDQGTVYAADRTGTVTAIDLQTGTRIWQKRLKNTPLTGATGAAHGKVLLGTGQGQVLALDQATGTQLWQTSVSSEVLAPPATDGHTVIVTSLDGRIHGLNAADGSPRWQADTQLPLLTLRGTAPPLIIPDLPTASGRPLPAAIIGQDSGKLAAYALRDGTQLWEARVGTPQGRTDLERMVDIDGRPLYHKGTLYALAFQAGLMALQPATGRALWFQSASASTAPAAHAGSLVITESSGQIRAFNAFEGTELWATAAYANRQLNAPAVANLYVAVADYRGYLHLLDRRSGTTIGRHKIGRQGIRTPTLLHNGVLLLLDNGGTLSAYKVEELE